MPRPRRIVGIVLAVIALVALGGGSVLLYRVAGLPVIDGRLVTPGLEAPVEVIRDRWGIPHIYAQGEEDLFFAQGYVHAQDRLWQMELSRRAAHGTLAEVLGERALGSDRLARTLAFTLGAQTEWAMLDAESRAQLAAYARGVNAFLTAPGRRLPIEFRLLGYSPAPWQPTDTLAWARLLAWSQDADWAAEALRARLVNALGPERAVELDPELVEAAQPSQAARYLGALEQRLLLEELGPSWPWATSAPGGNCWVVDGAHSASGSRILASDLQTPVQMPSPWYEMHLVGGRYDVAGASVPGVPCIVAGRNASLAWSYRDAPADVQDLFVERVRTAGGCLQGEYQGRWEDVQARQERIQVRGQAEPVQVTVYTTRHGPLVTVPAPGRPDQVALAWTGEGRPTAYVRSLPALNRAAGWEEANEALREWTVPAVGLVYADSRGNTGYVVGGAPNGVARACTLIKAGDTLAAGDLAAVQNDLLGPDQKLLSLLLALPPRGWIEERALPHLRRWDLHYDAESAGAAIYETFYRRFVHNTLDDELGAERVDAYLDTIPAHRVAIATLSEQPHHPWFDDLRTPQREDRDEIISRSFTEAVDWLGRRFGDLPSEWNWGRVHNVTFRHPLGQRWPWTLLLNRGAMRASGGPSGVVAASSDYGQGLVVRAAPSYRLIIDLAEGGQTLAINMTGQSGNPFSRHYADMIQAWREGRYHPLLMQREAILEAKEGVLTLAPGP